jgi:hypothetical protein
MVISTTLLTAGLVKKGLLLLLLNPNLVPERKKYEDWLDNDGFKLDHSKDPSKSLLFQELNRLKNKYRLDWDGEWTNENGVSKMVLPKSEDGRELSPGEIKMALESLELQIEKVRLMIEHEYSVIRNHHKPTGVYYIVVRSYWLNRNGNKFKKFNKNIGAEEKVLVNGEVPKFKIEEAKQEIDNMMWNHYKDEYGIS